MNTSQKGNGAERRVAADLEWNGWLVGSRRHIGGAGDLLAVRLRSEFEPHDVMLVEVKSSSVKRGRFADFPARDREALLLAAERLGAEAVLAWSPTPSRVELIASEDWPS